MITAQEVRDRIKMSERLKIVLAEIEREIKLHADNGWHGPLTVNHPNKRDGGAERDAIIARLTEAGFVAFGDHDSIRISIANTIVKERP